MPDGGAERPGQIAPGRSNRNGIIIKSQRISGKWPFEIPDEDPFSISIPALYFCPGIGVRSDPMARYCTSPAPVRGRLILSFLLLFIAAVLWHSPALPAFSGEEPLRNDPAQEISLLFIQTASPVSEPSAPIDRSDPSAPPAEVERLFSREYGKLLFDDARYILTAPARWGRQEWLTFSLATAGVGAALILDRPVQERIQRNRNGTTDRIAEIVEPFGTYYSLAVLGGFYLTGAAFNNPKAEAVALDGIAASLIASGIITPALKVAVGRSRPSEGEGAYDFHPFGEGRSFPSFHATQAFAVASVIATHYDPVWVKGTAYGVAALVGLARMNNNAHFLSDVTAGALIGTSVGVATVEFNRQQRGAISFTPMIDRERRGMTVQFHY